MTTNKTEQPGASRSGIEQRAAQDAGGAAQKVRQDFDAAVKEASNEAETLKSQAQDKIGEASEGAKSFASDQKKLAASQITGIASAISKVADELEGDQATTARYARDLAKGLDRFGKEVEGRSVDELMSDAQDFGRRQPLAFLGAAALAGFVASRFAGASAQRKQTGSETAVPGSAASGTTYGRTSAGGVNPTSGGSAYGQSSSNFAGGGNVSNK
ncbi:ElaB/YqjD/DUF883 family membrane-anchored ribosome-binding protein [Devosia subaequoris]|uniref:ElaB/YqjD/DUF883 family membrane-anchored ribosome-binding protein n=1 Tax=Devosia subaequoris TaxID=395930 RepID=A0A7W6IP96_9HYPH|nr:hypothetical protein [Devosia subaequoris]MBB4052746.1 ElaB/YqjD/DUF883 family membrane-anchored ribosome-binding protein [Devosia subaequoris]MCP1209899.1 hypothetical protein [Devosia subaequoris]